MSSATPQRSGAARGAAARSGLRRLLRPRSIAAVGGREAERLVVQLARLGYDGDVWPVHPRRREMGGRRAYPDVASLPAAPDASFVAVNRERCVEVVAALAARGAGGAVCYASGFGETGAEGAALQGALVEAAGEMTLVGPNCYGLVNYADRALLWADQFAGRALEPGERGVAILSQSSNLVINLDAQQRALPIAYLLTAGNQAQTTLGDLAAAVLEDERVSALGVYAEALGDVAGLEALAARARALAKPLVMLKVGRSEGARRAALTHTASIAGDDAAADALLARLGIARVDGLETFLETLKLLHVHGPLPGFEVAAACCSGGEAALVADAARASRLRFRTLDERARGRLASVLGPLVAVENPLDHHTYIWGDAAQLEATFEALLGDGFDLAMLLLDLPRADRCDDADWWISLDAWTRAARVTGARCAVVSTLAENLPEAAAHELMGRDMAPLVGVEHALAAVEAAAVIGAAWARPAAARLHVVAHGRADDGVDGETGRSAIRTLDEHEAKRRLGAAGVPVPEGRRVASAAEAVVAASSIGAPVALKALGVAHKSDVGALALDLATPAEVEHAARALLGAADALLVERMVDAPLAELLAGVRRVEGVGLALTVASGGVLVELFDDAQTLLLPCAEDDVREALARLRTWPMVEGHRGRPPASARALVGAVMALARFAADHRDAIEELEINPLIACAGGAFAGDALLRVREG